MSNSINTNVGAMVALASLRTTQDALNVASKQVQTGYRVSDAMEDVSTFSVAQGIRGNLQAFQVVQGSLANGVGLGSVTQAALTNISNLIGNLQAKITQLADGSIANDQRT
ncbi:MAG: flagellin, partial [Tagaea sp.]